MFLDNSMISQNYGRLGVSHCCHAYILETVKKNSAHFSRGPEGRHRRMRLPGGHLEKSPLAKKTMVTPHRSEKDPTPSVLERRELGLHD
jgi:hypothetical protein